MLNQLATAAGIAAAPVLLVLALAYGGALPKPASAQSAAEVAFTPAEEQAILNLSPLPAPPPSPTNRVADDSRAARLGRFLFFDRRLSANGEVACASCHQPAQGFTDGLPLAKGIGTAGRNAPTVLNAVHNRWYFWDGRTDSLWAQALQPLENPVEHGTNRLRIAHRVHGDPELRRAYEAVFGPLPALNDRSRFPLDARPVPGDPEHPQNQAWESMRPADQASVNRVFSNLGKAIAAYERRLISAGSAFDRFVAGLREDDADKQRALSPAAKRGLKLFVGAAQCTECHSGPNLTDKEFHNLGLAQMTSAEPDRGRAVGIESLRSDPFNMTGPFSDAPDSRPAQRLRFLPDPGAEQEGQFKTPTLRNVALTAPYMHDGRFATLTDVVRFYSTLEESSAGAAPVRTVGQREKTLRRLDLSEQDIEDLVAFLRSLTGKPLDEALTAPPSIP